MPEGKLICSRNGNRYKWYNSLDHNTIYLPKSEAHQAEILAQKQYIIARINDLSKEAKALKAYSRALKTNQSETDKFLSNPEYVRLISRQKTSFSKDIVNWLSEEYQQNPKHPENLKHSSLSGNTLRSKSEAFIDIALYSHNVPYRYEAALTLNGQTIYPDFTILHPITNKIYYWEHYGMLSNNNYRQEYLYKLNLYTSNNIIPSINLITTYETDEYPFTLIDAERIIHQYFL